MVLSVNPRQAAHFERTPARSTPITMITSTSPIGSAESHTNVLPAEQEVLNLRALLEQAEQKAAQERTEAARLAKEELKLKVQSILAQLNVQSAQEAIRIIEEECGLPSQPTAQPAARAKAKRAFPRALPQQTLDQMKSMLVAGATSRAVSLALKVGISTADSWKAKWGLTHGGHGRSAFKRAPKTRKAARQTTGSHFTPAKKARIVAALQKPGHRIAVIARREHTSRQALYDLRHKLEAQAA